MSLLGIPGVPGVTPSRLEVKPSKPKSSNVFEAPPLIPHRNTSDIAFPAIAIELVRQIFELSAHESKSTSLALTLVSKEVQKWVIPIIYHTVTLKSGEKLELFCNTVQNRPNVGDAVRTLIIRTFAANSALSIIAATIKACPHISSLITEGDMSNPTFSPSTNSSYPIPSHMVMMDSGLEGLMPPIGHPLLRNITHLYIYAIDIFEGNDIALVHSLVNLTHLACGCFGDDLDHWHAEDFPQRIKRILSSPSIAMVLLMAHGAVKNCGPVGEFDGSTWVELSEIEDIRLLARPGIEDFEHIALVESGKTIWDDAHENYKDWRNLVTNNRD